MASAAGVGGRRSVRRYLFALVAANLLVLQIIGIAGIVGTIRAHDSVHFLNEQVAPAVRANQATQQALTDAQDSLWGWRLTGDPSLLALYQAAEGRYRTERARLDKLARLDPRVNMLVDDFLGAADNWFAAYADPLAADTGGVPDSLRSDLFQRGLQLFTDIRITSAAVDHELTEVSADADQRADHTKTALVVLLAVALLAGGC